MWGREADCWCRGSTATTITAVCACVCVCVSDRVNELEWKCGCVMAHKSDEMTSPLLQHTAAVAAQEHTVEITDLLFSLVAAGQKCLPACHLLL